MKDPNIKICHIVSIDITVRFLLMPQLKFLMAQGYRVYAVCSPGKLTKEIEKEGITVSSIEIKRSISPISDLISLIKLYRYFKREKFDVVHTHAPKPGLLGQLAAKLAGVPIIINTVHGLYFTENSSFAKRVFFIMMEKIAAKCSTLIFSQNSEDIQTMIKEKIAPPEKIQYLGNGINVERFRLEKFPQSFIEAKKKELGLSGHAVVIGTVGRLVKEKGYLDLFEAMKIVIQKHPDVLLMVVGPKEPDKKDNFGPEIVTDYGIEKNVVFLGERKDVEQLYPLMDIFVLASHREGFPRSVIEAMVMERPIVVTNIRGCREEIENGKNGIIVAIKHPQELAQAFMFLLQHKDTAKAMAKQARLKATREFDEQLVFDKIKKAYKKLLEERLLS